MFQRVHASIGPTGAVELELTLTGDFADHPGGFRQFLDYANGQLGDGTATNTPDPTPTAV